MDLEFREARSGREGGEPGVRFRRTYREAGVSIGEGELVVGPRISRQIESLLDGVESVVVVDAIGRPVEKDWTSVTNPQVRQTLRMLRHAQILLAPRPRRGETNVGESWSYRLSANRLGSDRVETIEGEVRIRERLAELVESEGRRVAVIERELEAEASGTVRLPEGDGEHRFQLTADGSGEARFAVVEGALVQSRLGVERELRIEGPSGDTSERGAKLEWSLAEKERPAAD